ncbi:hypothetical protein [Nostoc sp. DSM 114159]|jgi:hypothetical protein
MKIFQSGKWKFKALLILVAITLSFLILVRDLIAPDSGSLSEIELT